MSRLFSLILSPLVLLFGSIVASERDEIQFLAHRFLGTGKIFGFPKITEAGCALEKQLLNDRAAKDALVIEKLKKFLTACEDAQDSSED